MEKKNNCYILELTKKVGKDMAIFRQNNIKKMDVNEKTFSDCILKIVGK